MITVHLPFLFAVALAGVASMIGQRLVQSIGFLKRNFIPEPLLGGLLFAFVIFLLRISNTLTITIPTQGPAVDFLVALLTANMGMHITPSILKHGAKLFLLFIGAGCVLAILQFLLVLPLAFTGSYPIHTAVLTGPLSFVGAPYNLNPPSQTAPVAELFREAYPNLKQLAQGIMMVGVVSSVIGANFISRNLFKIAERQPPAPSPVDNHPREPLGRFSIEISHLVILILVVISLAFAIQHILLAQLSWLRDDYLPVIVVAFLLGSLIRLSFSFVKGKDKFPEKAITVLLLGPTMNLVLAYAVMSIPLHLLALLTPRLLIGAIIAVSCSVGFSWFAFRLFAKYTNKYYAAVIATAFLAITTGWGPMGMGFLRRFIDEEGPVEPMPVIMPLNAFYLFPWMVVLLTTVILKLFG
ncbi:sodium--glutamate symport carrier gltS [Pontibacter ummariensis]|uniref:Sodium--glutamate symport carrier (GltS) n=1 Tax=Pontibacter ummariensis TaxID=1610492 RepID=A0A239JW46_9BACT|nr:sodium/glutamate symporter [Pontibacter ummariensis]PRY07301.1 sodium--glutamate symport carrier gltS [Pontibacter ummariensis]SNT10127.1 sodium--glutamate symport carrier (gltS) [Pontibacter ummariensis]